MFSAHTFFSSATSLYFACKNDHNINKRKFEKKKNPKYSRTIKQKSRKHKN